MNRKTYLKTLRTLQAEIDGVRSGLGISDRGEVLYSALLYADTDEEVVVVADGLGGATASVIEGNYPIDFFTRYEKTFSTERAAITAADKLIEEGVSPAEVLA